VAWLFALASPVTQMMIALAAYAVYVVNAAQFLVKLRRARLEASGPQATPPQSSSPPLQLVQS
jgi:3-vinyl bacteriochlorophyllide hydratase